MYAYMNGIVTEILQDSVVMEVAGIGYVLQVTEYTRQKIRHSGEMKKLYTHLSVREDGLSLFGFIDKEELSLFRLLLSVNGIGPKAAIAILSSFTPSELRFAILADDAKTIAKAPGVGPKTAKRIILDCKDKIDIAEAFSEEASGKTEGAVEAKESVGTSLPSGLSEDGQAAGASEEAEKEAILALQALGYTPAESFRAVRNAGASSEDDVEAVLKKALKQML